MRKLDNLERAWRVIQQNGRSSKSDLVKLDLERFGEDAARNLRSLKGKLAQGTFKFQKAKGIPIPKLDSVGRPTGKIRPIVLAPVETRVVQRAILNVLVELEALQPFVRTPYSFGGIRSTRQRGEQGRAEELAAVPAAIKAVLKEIEGGARFVACADIKAFFTRIPKEHVLAAISGSVQDPEFIDFLRDAMKVELSNMSQLREKIAEFPIEEMGVAQGSSLSPLVGNIALSNFDREMNAGDCRCIRYIDDFIIMAPTQKAANARLRLAKTLLKELGMELSPEKTAVGGTSVEAGFDFLGISVRPGLIRPTAKAQSRFLRSLDQAFADAKKAMLGLKQGKALDRTCSLIGTLKRVDGMIDGWGKHYWFCNDGQVLRNLDDEIQKRVTDFVGTYRSLRSELPLDKHAQLLGVSELKTLRREPFTYPRLRH